MKKAKYRIKPEYLGKDVYTIKPEYDRPQGAKFRLDKNLSDTDMAFLFEVVGYEGIERS